MADAGASPPAFDELDSEDVVTVETLNNEIADVVESAVDLHHEYVVGDVSDCGEANGNVHFDLVFGDASIHCVLFGFRRDQTAVEPEADMQVAVQGELSYYQQQGSCSMLVTDVVELGTSQYSQVYEENRTKLEADGLLAEERKQELPALPETVGLVTSADSDARVDAVTAIHDRYPDVEIKLRDASVQGDSALQELMSAVSALDDDPTVDVIVVTRGGGADKTLRVFNEAPLCRVIAETDTPIVVGVGHEDDRTLADEVADQRVMTPTHAGEVVPERAALEADIDQVEARFDQAYTSAVESELTRYATDLHAAYETMVTTRIQDLRATLEHAFDRQVASQLADYESQLDRAYREVERQKEHEERLQQEVTRVRDEAKAEAEAAVASQHRRYRIALVVLTLLVVALFVIVLLQL